MEQEKELQQFVKKMCLLEKSTHNVSIYSVANFSVQITIYLTNALICAYRFPHSPATIFSVLIQILMVATICLKCSQHPLKRADFSILSYYDFFVLAY